MLDYETAVMRQTRDERAADPKKYPSLGVASPGLMYESLPLPVPTNPAPLEVVFVQIPRASKASIDYRVGIIEWNVLWESAQLRGDMFEDWKQRHGNVPDWLARYGDRNIHFVPDIPRNPAQTFAPLYSMLPANVLQKVALPANGAGLWPLFLPHDSYGDMPRDADARFERALSLLLWPRLMGRKLRHSYSDSHPIRILTHSPTFWMPHALHVCFERAGWYDPRGSDDWDESQRHNVHEVNTDPINIEAGVTYRPSRYGGPLWEGEDEAAEAADEVVERADSGGRLRALIDAVLSHRVHDDFSECWSREREDFDRAMHHKRAKVHVAFVELPEKEAIHSAFTQFCDSPERDVIERLMFNDFLALLDERNRRIVVAMRRGVTTASEISRVLGYANHSPVTKRLRKIRTIARQVFFEDRSL